MQAGRGTESKTGTESQLRTGLKLRTGLGLKTSMGSESKARRGFRMTSIDTKDEKINYMSMLTELRTLIIGKPSTRKGKTSAGSGTVEKFEKLTRLTFL
ncbi:hypothetical protein EVAR_46956_1 [Eumeta japonica]|uniref:Uncharacterized protein n=1 Tax=Eumeta variegata TaxID=151549 RepID=A0A4C1YIY9_EUMVA|nr:hypothetical protein EVAR_46956_1 [Eumeta japonica]